jgi:CubicO group peptidase (beta-lactamase class C family)
MATLFQSLCDPIPTWLQRYRVPGLAVAVLHNGQNYAQGFGVRSIENPLPVTPDTLFQIGSISKTFLGTTVMRLVEQDRLDLDVPIRSYLPGFKLVDEGVAAHVTMRHLLTHTGGWLGDYFNDTGWGDDALAKMLDEIATLPQLTPLGQIWSYNNAGFNIAGRVIEVITGQTFEQAMQSLLLDPLQLTHSHYFPWEVMVKNFAVGHISPQDESEPVKVGLPWPLGRSSHPAGGVVSSVNELLKYAAFHLGDGTLDERRVLSRDSLQQMQATQTKAYSSADEWGLTWAIRYLGDARLVRHGGATRGFNADLTLLPTHNFAVITLTNSDRGSELYSELMPLALKLFCNVSKPDAQPINLPDENLREYVGDYEAKLNNLLVRLGGDALTLQYIPKGGFPKHDSPPTGPALPPARMAFDGPDKGFITEGAQKGGRFEFLRDADGMIVWLHLSGRVHRLTPDPSQGSR